MDRMADRMLNLIESYRILENAYEMANLRLKPPLQNGLFLIFLCESNRYFGKTPMKWPLTDRKTSQIWPFLNVSSESLRYP